MAIDREVVRDRIKASVGESTPVSWSESDGLVVSAIGKQRSAVEAIAERCGYKVERFAKVPNQSYGAVYTLILHEKDGDE